MGRIITSILQYIHLGYIDLTNVCNIFWLVMIVTDKMVSGNFGVKNMQCIW